MAFSSCFFSQAPLSFKASCSAHGSTFPWRTMIDQRLVVARKNLDTELVSQQRRQLGPDIKGNVSFFGKSAAFMHPNLVRRLDYKRISRESVSCLPSSQLASSVFGLGTAAVLPFYTLMIVAPKAEFTKKLMGSSLPYIALGLLYAYLLYLSWTPDTIRLMFSGQNWMPELPAIAKLFSGDMTLASAWIHLLAIDLFAARQVYHDGLQENVETRHSISLCLLFCPIGVLTHFLTKALTKSTRQGTH